MKNVIVFSILILVATIFSTAVIVLVTFDTEPETSEKVHKPQNPEIDLNEEQRQQILSLKQQTASKMDTLLIQLNLVKQEHEEQLLEVLTPEQKEAYLQRKQQKEHNFTNHL